MRRLAALACLPLLLAGCSTPAPAATPATVAPAASGPAATTQPGWLAGAGLAGLSATQVVETLDRSTTPRPLAFKASVRPGEVQLEQGGQAVTLTLPSDRFYLSIAPYVTHTHDCFHHSLATCRGELASTPAHVTIIAASGQVLADADVTTYSNGFVGFWLPRDVTGTVRVTTGGKTGEVSFATGQDSPTCLTTLRLT